MSIETEMNTIIQIFERQSELKESYKLAWFNAILKELEVFGYQPFKNSTVSKGLVLPSKYIDEVSISRFVMVDINGLYIQAFLRLFDNEDQWSHPAVLRILKYPLKRHCYQFAKMAIYSDIKLFKNMLLGMLNSNKSNLSLDRVFNYTDFRNTAAGIVDEVIELSGRRDALVVVDVDVLIFGCHRSELNPSIETAPNVEVQDYENLSEQGRRVVIKYLNYHCRKFNIDIVP